MDCLPDQLVWEILDRIEKPADRNSLSLTCKRLNKLDGEQRKSIRVNGCGLDPAYESLTCICNRFPYLEKVEIVYSGWMSNLGKQLDDEGLRLLSSSCPFLNDLTLSYCTYITDGGLSSLASCSNLSALKLKFAPRITGCGMLSLVIGCKKLTLLHLIRCFNVTSAGWLEYLGNLETLEDLFVKNCRAITEGDLVKLGPGWGTLKRLHFEVDASNYRYMKSCDLIAIDRWQEQRIPCKSMLELTLVNCIISPGRGLSCILGKCENLMKIQLDMCMGLKDSDIISLAKKAKSLRSISLRLASDYSYPTMIYPPFRLTDESLNALAQNCSLLDSVRLCYSSGQFPAYSLTLDGIIALIQMCPIRELVLDRIDCFSDVGMDTLCSANHLEVLEIIRCEEVTDEGLQLMGQFPRLQVFRLSKCMGVTDDGFKLLVGTRKLQELSVEGCPLISERGVQGVAKSVAYNQDLSWIYSGL